MNFNFTPLSYETVPAETSCGVYCLRCKGDGRIYIGGSGNVRKRLYSHFAMLKNGYHQIPAVNEATKRYGYGAWEWALVESCSKDDLEGRETYWIQETRCFEAAIGFNTLRSAYGPTEEMKQRQREWCAKEHGSVTFISPIGDIEREVVSRVDFAREIGVTPKELYAVVGGRVPHISGWALKEAPRHVIYDPSGKRYSYVSRNVFRRITGCPANLPKIERRPTWQHHGWSQTLENCLANRPPAPPNPKKVKQAPTPKKPLKLLSPAGEVVEFESRGHARRVIGGDKSMFYKMLSSKKYRDHTVRSYRGWRPAA